MKGFRWGAVLSVARSELRSGARGFRLFLLCLAIGAASIAAAGSTASAFRAGLADQARAILGGDLSFELTQREAPLEAVAYLEARGVVSQTIEARAMAAGPKARRLAEVRGVDGRHPLVGAVELQSGAPLQERLKPVGGLPGVVAERALFEALGVKVGDRIALAAGEAVLTDVIEREPGALGRGFAIAPRLLMARDAVAAIGLAQEGSLYDVEVSAALSPGVDPAATAAALQAQFPELKGRVRTRDEAAPDLKATLDRLEAFLGFVGLAALLAGGLGVQGAVTAYVESRRAQIATLKTLGASGGEVRAIVALNVGALAALGILAGLAIGAAAPFLAVALAGDTLPLPAIAGLDPRALAAAAALSGLAAIAFAAAPIGIGRATPPAALFRGGEGGRAAPWPERVAGWLALGALVAAAALFSPTPLFAAALTAGAFAAFAVLRGMGWLAGRLARGRAGGGGVWGLALAGLGGRGSLAPAAAPAIGLGVALLAFLTQVQANLVTQVEETAPRRFATAAFVEVPPGEGPAFDALADSTVKRALAPEWYQRYPVVTVRVVALNGREIDPQSLPEDGRWVAESDLSATFVAPMPPTYKLVEGRWWPPNYAGPPLVSLEDDAAKPLQAKPGDVVTFDVLGRTIDATVANVREIDFEAMGPPFAMTFAPGTFEAANPRSIVLVRLDSGPQERLEAAVGAHFPTVVILRIRDALQAAADLFKSLALAIQSVAGVAIAAGALAVAGAIAAGARRRLYEAAILKTLGFTRGQIVAALALEMGLVGVVAAGLGVALGFAAAWPVIVLQFEATWSPAWLAAGAVVGGAALALALVGALAARVALSAPPARVLRSDA